MQEAELKALKKELCRLIAMRKRNLIYGMSSSTTENSYGDIIRLEAQLGFVNKRLALLKENKELKR